MAQLAQSAQQLNSSIAEAGGSVRNSGCTSLDLAYVAAGRLDGAWLSGLNEMTMLAGCLLIQEAGGLISDFHGGQGFVASGNLATSGAKLFKPLLQLVRKTCVVD
jgi:myo-inositol-1(or 4)-monophosphatase